MRFKIGDKVRICKTSRWKKRIKETVGIVKGLQDKRIEVKWETNGCIICGIDNSCVYRVNVRWHQPYDIEPVVTKGEQLLFNFKD